MPDGVPGGSFLTAPETEGTMEAAIGGPTPYADVNAVVASLLAELRAVLRDQFAGLYLHGSLATGDFDPATSDIDFVVVTGKELPNAAVVVLAAMHRRIRAGGSAWAARLEGSYIPRPALRRYDPANARHPSLKIEGGGQFGVRHHHSDWVIQRHILRQHGVVVAAPPPGSLIDPVSPDQLRAAVRTILTEWWARSLDDATWLATGEYQAFAVLTMCRALHTLRHGTVVSKPAAARWAGETLPAPWPAIIDHARNWQDAATAIDLSSTLAFIRFTLAQARLPEP